MTLDLTDAEFTDLTRVEAQALREVLQDCVEPEYSVTIIGPADLGRRMGLSRPRAHKILERLASKGFLEHIPRKGHVLSPRGTAYLDEVHRKHRVIETYLVARLGIATEDACHMTRRFDDGVDPVIISALCAELEHPEVCPHGEGIAHHGPD